MNILDIKQKELKNKTTKEIFEISGGVFEGHTEFRNGMHSEGWIEKGFVMRHPNLMFEITRRQSEDIKTKLPNSDLLVGPAINGSIVASFNSLHLKKLLATTHGKGHEIAFHRMHVPDKSLKICLIEDLVFTGTDIKHHITFFKNFGITLLGVSVWISRKPKEFVDVPMLSLMDHPFKSYDPEKCPQCENKIPLKYKNIRE